LQQVHGLGGEQSCILARDEVRRLEQLWSVSLPESEVSALADAAGERRIAVDEDTFEILAVAKQLYAETEGVLNVMAGPLMELWRTAAERGSPPSAAELARVRELVDIDGLSLGPGRSAQLSRAGQSLDLGAVGKGFAADRCIELYQQRGARYAWVDLGGNVSLLGTRPDGRPWRIGIQAPGRPRGDCFGYIEASDCSVVTSGSYERWFDVGGRRYSHVIDPMTGLPVATELRSATVVASSSVFADGLATACLVLGTARSLELAQALRAEVLLLDDAGVHLTPGLESAFHPA
jgi:thiamine biosynthesis lipoprotein